MSISVDYDNVHHVNKTEDSKQYSGKTGIVATALLVVVLIIYFCSSLLTPQYPWLVWIKSFCEAASVGAIADWFAVTALFRHPLGIPIPHTAIIARQRDRLARGLGEFIDRNFLSKDVLKRKIIDENAALRVINWTSRHSSTTGLPAIIRKLTGRSLGLLGDRSFLTLINQNPTQLLKNITLSPFAGNILRFLVEADTNQEICAGLIIQLKTLLASNSSTIENFIARKLPWYIPEFIHRPAFHDFLAKVRSEIDAIELDMNHPARQKFSEYLLTLARELETDKSLQERGENIKRMIVTSPVIAKYISLLVHNLHDDLKAQIADESSGLSKALTGLAASFSTNIREDLELQQTLNFWLFDVVSCLGEDSSLNFSYLVQEVFSSWDTKTVVSRIEEQVSNDLQFIRINGTLIGGLVGIALHACQVLVSSNLIVSH